MQFLGRQQPAPQGLQGCGRQVTVPGQFAESRFLTLEQAALLDHHHDLPGILILKAVQQLRHVDPRPRGARAALRERFRQQAAQLDHRHRYQQQQDNDGGNQ